MKAQHLTWLLVPLVIGLAAYGVRSGYLRRQWEILRGVEAVLECPRVVEFGEQERGEIAVRSLTIANRGGRDLILDEIQSSCTCSGLEREKNGEFIRVESLRLRPGEAADLVIRVSVQGAPETPGGSQITFRTNDPLRPRGTIDALISKVKAGATAVPTTVTFGKLALNQEAVQVLDVYDNSPRPRAIKSVRVANPDRANVRLQPADQNFATSDRTKLGSLIGRVEVVALTNAPGPLETDIEIHLTGPPRPPTLVAVSGRVTGPIELSPTVLALPRASGDGLVYSGECLCRSTSGKSLILSVDVLPPGVTARITSIEGSPTEQRVTVTLDPGSEEATVNHRRRVVRLSARMENEELSLEIPVIRVQK